MNGNYTILSPSAIEYLCGVLRDMDNVSEGLNDLAIQTDSTFSSYKINQLLTDLENNVKLYSDDLVSHLTHLKLEMANDVSEVVKENTMYLVSTATPNAYDQYVLVQGVPKNIGGTQIDLTNYITKDDADAKYETIANVDDIRNVIGSDALETEDKTLKGAINEVKQNLEDFNVSWNGTKAEFEALDKSTLKDGQTVNLTDDYEPNNYASKKYVDEKALDVYSTEETVCGKWIDGKPIYRRVFIGSWSATVNTWTTTNISVVGFETLVSASCKRNAKEGNLPIAQVSANSGTSLQVTVSTGTQTIKQIILEYTKTTDV